MYLTRSHGSCGDILGLIWPIQDVLGGVQYNSCVSLKVANVVCHHVLDAILLHCRNKSGIVCILPHDSEGCHQRFPFLKNIWDVTVNGEVPSKPREFYCSFIY